MKNLLIILVVLFAAVGCGNQKTLESNSTVTKVFNDSEIHDLTLILEFFNKQICSLENKKGSDINDCYNKFIQRMIESAETGNMEINIPFKEQIELYNAIDEQTFNEIWQMGWQRTPRLSIDTLTYIDLKNHSKYVSFLNEYGKESDFIKEYHNSLKMSGGIGPAMISNMMMSYEYYDIYDIRMKLVFAIHYLTLNDQFNRKEKYQN